MLWRESSIILVVRVVANVILLTAFGWFDPALIGVQYWL